MNLPTCVVTFWPHPRIVLNKNPESLRLLSSLEEKEQLIKGIGIDHFIVLPFTQDFSQLTAEEFIRTTLIHDLHIRHLTVGYDHHIGRGGQTDYEQIRAICQTVGIEAERVAADHRRRKGIKISNLVPVLKRKSY